MRKWVAVLLMISMILSFCACENKEKDAIVGTWEKVTVEEYTLMDVIDISYMIIASYHFYDDNTFIQTTLTEKEHAITGDETEYMEWVGTYTIKDGELTLTFDGDSPQNKETAKFDVYFDEYEIEMTMVKDGESRVFEKRADEPEYESRDAIEVPANDAAAEAAPAKAAPAEAAVEVP